MSSATIVRQGSVTFQSGVAPGVGFSVQSTQWRKLSPPQPAIWI